MNILEKDKTIKKAFIKNLKCSNNLDIDENSNLEKNEILLDANYDLPISNELFCPILTPAERTRLIKLNTKSGIDESESCEIMNVRKSREFCGCSCKVACLKETCSCIINDIGCQLDKTRFPCSCSIRQCKNPNGIKRFDPLKVRKHYDYILNPEFFKLNYEETQISKRRKLDNNDENNEPEKVKKRSNKRGRKTKVKKIKSTKRVSCEETSHVNKCLDLLPYEPFDLFKFLFKFNNN